MVAWFVNLSQSADGIRPPPGGACGPRDSVNRTGAGTSVCDL